MQSKTNKEKNPWWTIPESDHEGHMGNPQVGELELLSSTFRNLLHHFRPQKIAIVNCEMGTGFEHIDTEQVERVIGIDTNPVYLKLLRDRYSEQLPQLKLICKNVLDVELQSSSLDFIFAGLLFAYENPEATLSCFAKWLAPKGILATVLRLPCEEISFAESSYMRTRKLEIISSSIDPVLLTEKAKSCGLRLKDSKVETLPGGEQFFIGCYDRAD